MTNRQTHTAITSECFSAKLATDFISLLPTRIFFTFSLQEKKTFRFKLNFSKKKQFEKIEIIFDKQHEYGHTQNDPQTKQKLCQCLSVSSFYFAVCFNFINLKLNKPRKEKKQTCCCCCGGGGCVYTTWL